MPEGSKIAISKIVFDILKPHIPPLVDFVTEIASVSGLEKVDATIVEVDADTDTVKLVVEGNDINLEKLKEVIKKTGAVIHSIDQVVAVKR
ncbi:MAG TPA: hypothetical protein EYH45_07275 [Candidatus Caldiarchaeum subterraneum]|uniref:DUF211 domain-containing protein n=1 Tax=Caldiarchaeum subterraneum TaxID=311458 RepID=A0A833EAB4_CALS0|nr:hypothetical protein [Candidatus Caldarchaeum subterraneum]